jgi:hypothetical protein
MRDKLFETTLWWECVREQDAAVQTPHRRPLAVFLSHRNLPESHCSILYFGITINGNFPRSPRVAEPFTSPSKRYRSLQFFSSAASRSPSGSVRRRLTLYRCRGTLNPCVFLMQIAVPHHRPCLRALLSRSPVSAAVIPPDTTVRSVLRAQTLRLAHELGATRRR